MPDILDANGLQVKTLQEILSDLTTGMQGIYGSDINVDQNSPDGQFLNIVAQAGVDLRELIVQVNANFDPDRAAGTILDERVVINSISRRGGTYTTQPIDITVDRTVNLQGLDDAFDSASGTGYTVQDAAGNQFILIESVTLTAGTSTQNFRAALIGRVETTVGTITIPVTIILGVASVTNNSGPLTLGENEETDAELRIRRQQSVALSSSGYLNGLLGTILLLDGVAGAKLYENVTNSTDADGIPAHGIWAIVDGGADNDIGNAIYTKKSFGANMKGAQSVIITTASGGTFTALFDRPSAENLYIRFNIQPIVVTPSLNVAAIKQYIVDNLTYDISQAAETSRITAVALAAINDSGSGGVPTEVQISTDNSTWLDYIEVTTLDQQFLASTARITITVL